MCFPLDYYLGAQRDVLSIHSCALLGQQRGSQDFLKIHNCVFCVSGVFIHINMKRRPPCRSSSLFFHENEPISQSASQPGTKFSSAAAQLENTYRGNNDITSEKKTVNGDTVGADLLIYGTFMKRITLGLQGLRGIEMLVFVKQTQKTNLLAKLIITPESTLFVLKFKITNLQLLLKRQKFFLKSFNLGT